LIVVGFDLANISCHGSSDKKESDECSAPKIKQDNDDGCGYAHSKIGDSGFGNIGWPVTLDYIKNNLILIVI
jgi:hypothetical protein